jgi:hypothetical protein
VQRDEGEVEVRQFAGRVLLGDVVWETRRKVVTRPRELCLCAKRAELKVRTRSSVLAKSDTVCFLPEVSRQATTKPLSWDARKE